MRCPITFSYLHSSLLSCNSGNTLVLRKDTVNDTNILFKNRKEEHAGEDSIATYRVINDLRRKMSKLLCSGELHVFGNTRRSRRIWKDVTLVEERAVNYKIIGGLGTMKTRKWSGAFNNGEGETVSPVIEHRLQRSVLTWSCIRLKSCDSVCPRGLHA